LFYDLLVVGITFLLQEHSANRFIFLSLFGNPVDLARVGSLIELGIRQFSDYAGAALVKFLGRGAWSAVILILGFSVWISGPLTVAAYRIRRQDI
jgi:hypothetical protein